MAREFWRGGVKVAEAVYLSCLKTLGSTGEHDVWSGSGALPQPAGTVIRLSSSSAQDASTITDVWTISSADGTDFAQAVEVDGVLHAAVPLPSDTGWERLVAAINSGSKTTYAVIVETLPDVGDDIVVSVGETDYPVEFDHLDADAFAAAIAAAMAADPSYDVVAAGGESGAILLTAKAPNVASPAVTAEFPVEVGTVNVLSLVTHGPASAVMTAAEDDGDLVLTADAAGTAYAVSAESDNLNATHTLTGGSGTGIRTALVRYLDAQGQPREEVLTLTGTAAVSTSQTATALLEVQARTVGSAGAAAGTVTVTDGAESPTTLATIAAGDAETHRVAWTAGVAQRFVVVGVHAQNVGGQPATLRIRATGPTGARLLAQHALPLLGEQLLLDLSDSPIRLDAGETVRATLEGNGSSCHVALLGYTEG